MKKIFLIIFLGGLFLPVISLAYGAYGGDGKTIIYDGLVPCGKGACIADTTNPEEIKEILTVLEDFKRLWPEETFEEHCKDLGRARVYPLEWIEAKDNPCQFCHFFVMFKGIIDFVLVYIIFPVAALLFILGGAMFFLYTENPKRVDEAKSLLTSVVIGLVLIFAAWLVISLFFTLIGLSNFALQFTGPDKWFTIDCPIKF